jgi:hypothetical protein
MIVLTVLGMALLCLLFDSTRLLGLIALVLLSILYPVIFLVLLALVAGLYVSNLPFLTKE